MAIAVLVRPTVNEANNFNGLLRIRVIKGAKIPSRSVLINLLKDSGSDHIIRSNDIFRKEINITTNY